MIKAYCSFRQVPSAAKSLSLFAGFTLFNRIGKSGAEIFSPTPLYCFFYFCVLLFLYLHRLVGLRLLRLCLKLRRGFAPRPCNGFHPLTLTRGVPLDLLLASLGVLFYSILVICSVGYAHSSLLTPHSSFIPALSAIHRCYLRQSLRQSIIKLIKAFQSPLPICSHC